MERTTSRFYRLYRPFFLDVGGGTETTIEQVAVNERDLQAAVKHLGTMGAHRTIAFFGERERVLDSVAKTIDEAVEVDRNATTDSIYIAIKGTWVVAFAIIDDQFFKQKPFDKECLVVTLFRYLQDFTRDIVLCLSDEMATQFFPGPKNPFSAAAHTTIMFALQANTCEQLKIEDVTVNTTVLQRELGYKFPAFVLNENGSKYFLHCDRIAETKETLQVKMAARDTLIFELFKIGFNHVPATITDMIHRLKLENMSSDLLGRLISAHRNYVYSTQNFAKYFGISLAEQVLKRAYKKLNEWKFYDVKTWGLILTHELEKKFEASATNVAELAIEQLLSQSKVLATIDQRILESSYDFCLKNLADILHNLLKHEKPLKVVDQAVESELSLYTFTALIDRSKLESFARNFIVDVKQIFTHYAEVMTQRSTLKLSTCTINLVQNAEGACTAFNIGPFSQSVVIPLESLAKHLELSSQAAPNLAKFDQALTIRAMFPVKGGRVFLVLFEYLGKHKSQALLAVSAAGISKRVVRWKMNEYQLVPIVYPNDSESQSFEIAVLSGSKDPSLNILEVNESLNPKQYMIPITGSLGKVVSIAFFSARGALIVLNSEGNLYKLRLQNRVHDQSKISAAEWTVSINDGNKVRKQKVMSADKRIYTSVHSFKSSNFFALMNDSVIDIYDSNFTRLSTVAVAPRSVLKLFYDKANVYAAVFGPDEVRGFVLPELGSEVTLRHQVGTEESKPVGNPIIDVIHASWLKYGPNSHFIGAPKQNKYWTLVAHNEHFRASLQSYLETFKTPIDVSIAALIDVTAALGDETKPMLSSVLLSRVPVHVCTVEENNLQPLVDGKRQRVMADRAKSIAEAIGCVSFAHLEAVIRAEREGDSTGIRVISIIGRQSSGKSYLLNRLFGTRFMVAANRCTDGIWMAYATLYSKDGRRSQSFLVLDCEGLFSINRNDQEEVKLLTVLAAISDVTILNQDLNFSRHINRLFTNLNNAVNRVRGSAYFKGMLMIAVRDVASIEQDNATQEFKRNVQTLQQVGGYQFIQSLFSSTMILHCFNNFENREVFGEELDETRERFFDYDFEQFKVAKQHWTDGPILSYNLKVVLMQVYNDDEQSADKHIILVRKFHLENQVVNAWGEISIVGDKLSATCFKHPDLERISQANAEELTLQIAQSEVQFEFKQQETEAGYTTMHDKLMALFFKADRNPREEKQGFNARWVAFNDLFTGFVRQRVELLEEFGQLETQKLGQLQEEEKKHFLLHLKKIIGEFANNYSLCLERCCNCSLLCLERRGHKEIMGSRLNTLQKLEKKIETLPAETRRDHNVAYVQLTETERKYEEAVSQVEESEKQHADASELCSIVEKLEQINEEIAKNEASQKSKGKLERHPTLNYFLQMQQQQLSKSLDAFQVVLTSMSDRAGNLQNLNGNSEDTEAAEQKAAPIDTGFILENQTFIDQFRAFLSDNEEETGEFESKLEYKLDGLRIQVAKINPMVTTVNKALKNANERVKRFEKLRNQIELDREAITALQNQISGLEMDVSEAKQNIDTSQHELDQLKLQQQRNSHEYRDVEKKFSAASTICTDFTNTYQSLDNVRSRLNECAAKNEEIARKLAEYDAQFPLLLDKEQDAVQLAAVIIEFAHLESAVQKNEEATQNAELVNVDEYGSSEFAQRYENDRQRDFAAQVQHLRAKISQLSERKKSIVEAIETKTSFISKLSAKLQRWEVNRVDDDGVPVTADEVSTTCKKVQDLESEKQALVLQFQLVEAVEKTEDFARYVRLCEIANELNYRFAKHFNDRQVQAHARSYACHSIVARDCQKVIDDKGPEQMQTDENVPNQQEAAFQSAFGRRQRSEASMITAKESIISMFWNEQVSRERKQLRDAQIELDGQQSKLQEELNAWTQAKSEYDSLGDLANKLKASSLELPDVENAENRLLEFISYLNSTQIELESANEHMKTDEKQLVNLENEYKDQSVLLPSMRLNVELLSLLQQAIATFTPTVHQVLERAESWKLDEATANEVAELQRALDKLHREQDELATRKRQLDQKRLGSLEAIGLRLEELRKSSVSLQDELKRCRETAEMLREHDKLKAEINEVDRHNKCHCPTDHKCDQLCAICIGEDEGKRRCKHAAGHEGTHCCNKEKHDCPGKCHVCDSPCVHLLNHNNPAQHLCASTHQCQETCEFCPNTCVKYRTDRHVKHVCAEKRCPKRCILCSKQCIGKHDHDECTTEVQDPSSPSSMVKLHLCENEHNCPSSCAKAGICEVHYVSETRMWSNPECPQEYEYIKPEKKTMSCLLIIPAGGIKHSGKHDCGKAHTCDKHCPECGSFCKLPFGHSGLHKTVTHRNKELCYCLTRTSDQKVTIPGEAGKQARIYKPGDNFILETCAQQCARKGRAHFHLKECPGGENCGAVKFGPGVKHCGDTERYYPHPDKVYDKFLCATFWSSAGWYMPCEESDIGLCNYYCPHSSHSEEMKTFCSAEAWHTESSSASKHFFDCHDFEKLQFNGLDVCFCIDTTGSMSSYIKQCVKAMKRIMSDALPQLARYEKDASCLRFAVVGYKDHCDNQVVTVAKFATADEISGFLDKVSACGGGDVAEAVLDGLDAAVELPWQTESLKMMFHICDAPPHGKKFITSSDDHPGGCPCGLDEVTVLRKLKDKNITYIVVPLSSYLNNMINIFETHITVIRKDITGNIELSTMIAETVCKAIEDNELTATSSDF